MASMAQLNTRMSPALKAAGDSVLELYGISASELIRAVWDKVSHGEVALRQLLEVLATEPAVGTGAHVVPQDDRHSMASMIRDRQAQFASELGLDLSTYTPLTDEELDDLVYQDFLEEQEARHAC